MSDGSGARLIGAILLGSLSAAAGWYGRGIYDGLTISVNDAQKQAQGLVNGAVEKAGEITKAKDTAADSKGRVQKVIEKVYVDKACPPGTGAVSDDLAARLRVKFGPTGKDTATR